MKLNIYLAIILLAFFSSCENNVVGPEGPEGPQGPPGKDGEEAYTFDYEGIDFTASNDFSVLINLPEDFDMLDSDVLLVYFLWGVDEDTGNEIWRALPQTIITNDGLLQYNFDFTTQDVSLFLDADYDLNILDASFTDDWVVRVVVIPSQFENNGRVNLSDYNAVAAAFNLPNKSVSEKYKSIQRP